jgi:plastocyanin
MRNTRTLLALLAASSIASLFVGASGTKPLAADDHNRKIAIRDDCDPRDPAWNPSGGCALEEGDVTNAEFGVELQSPLAPTSVIGHSAWRNDPPYLKIREGETVRVRNRGGRAHTFTEVANFGGGKIPNPALNKGLVTALECPASTNLAPGASTTVANLAPGNHRFQCCIHPWMRAIVKVKPAGDHDDEEEDGDN